MKLASGVKAKKWNPSRQQSLDNVDREMEESVHVVQSVAGARLCSLVAIMRLAWRGSILNHQPVNLCNMLQESEACSFGRRIQPALGNWYQGQPGHRSCAG